jgi:hypothetical protein
MRDTTEFAQTEIVQNKLELLKEVILPNQDFKVAQPMERYNGNREQCKNPIVSQLSGNVCSVRLGGGMGWP